MVIHLAEVDLATGRIVAEWKNDPQGGRPVAPAGRMFFDVTAQHLPLGEFVTRGATVVGGTLTLPEAPGPEVDLRTFLRLFTRAEALAIAARREVDPDVAYFWLMLTAGQTVTLNHPDTAAGLDLLIAKSLLTPARKAAIVAHQPPPPS